MLSKIRSPFKPEDPHDHKRTPSPPPSSSTMAEVGLRIIAQISSQNENDQNHPNNVVLQSAVRPRQPVTKKGSPIDSCFLKTCNLCNKGLSLDKEVYMYRGDLGFCSKECRNRQIFLEEKRELADSTKKMVAAYRSSCNSGSNNETRSILEDLIHSRQTYMNAQHRRNNPAVFIF